MIARSGTSLAELLVALVMAGVVMATAMRGLSVHLRIQRMREARVRTQQAVADVAQVLRVESSRAVAPPVLRGDTGIDLTVLRGAPRACEASSSRVTVSNKEAWWDTPRVGDAVTGRDTLTRGVWQTTIAAVGSQSASAGCPFGGVRLTLATVPPMTVPLTATPLQVMHTERFVLYRAADGFWWFGQRACAATCGAAQPVAGPLQSPDRAGLRFASYTDESGRRLAIDLTVRASDVEVTATQNMRLPVVGVR